MGLGKTLTSLGTAAAITFTPEVAHAGEQHNHAVFGVEAGPRSVMAHGGYFREIGGHVSTGIAAGLGKGFHGETVGAIEGMVAYHKTISHGIAKGVFVVFEAGGGLEMVSTERGLRVEPIAKGTGLLGVQLNNTVGVFAGVNYGRTPDANHGSVSVGTVLGF